MKTLDEISEEQSQRIFWVIQTVFSLLLARSFIESKEVLLSPFTTDHWVAMLALVLVYTTALLSWIDYSFTSIVSPYRLGKGTYEKLRFASDLAIVGCYALLLFSTQRLVNDSSSDTTLLFGLFLATFVLYAASGYLRILQFGPRASSLRLIMKFVLAYAALLFLYRQAHTYYPYAITNATFILAALALMIFYRAIRAKNRRRKRCVGIDVDGVLANQIDGILPIAKAKGGRDYSYADIVGWRMEIGDTDIAEIIVGEQRTNKHYVTSMPVHHGAREALDSLIKRYRIAIVTARNPSTDGWTKSWLRDNKIHYDYYENSKEGAKQNTDTDITLLIDDYPGNIEKFLGVESHRAVLLTQPWNKTHGLQEMIESGRLIVASDWSKVPDAVAKLLGESNENDKK